MSSTQFSADMDDIRFVLFDQLDIDQGLKVFEAYADFDQETYSAMLDEAHRMAVDVLHPIDGPGDQEGVHFDPATGVTTPAGFKDAWTTMAEGGWVAVAGPPEAGGSGLPHSIAATVSELFSGSAMAFTMYMGLTSAAARIVYEFGEGIPSSEMIAEKMFTGEWGGTMCLTEAGAGSDVGANRCKAVATEDDRVYLLEGEKVFISGADHDLTDNILHLVLARTADAPAGTKGLGLFLVPKFNFDTDGTLGERNDAVVVGIEEKMGIHGSSTCTLALGANGPCRGWLVGDERQGIEIMFHMMNEARLGVAAQGLAIGSAAFQYAKSYVHERLQGSTLDKLRDADAPRVAIVNHPDVRHMLMTQRVLVQAMRSFVLRVTHRHDVALHTEDKAEAERLMGVVDLLVPVLKAHCTDVGFDVAVLALQTFGGAGYISEYPVEQLVRDGKIMSIYEGTNGIQAMDLLGRKLRQKGGALFMQWMQENQALLEKAGAAGIAEAGPVGKGMQHLGAAAMHLGGMAMKGEVDGAMLHATNFLRMFGVVQLGLETVEQALVAKTKIDAGETSSLLTGKLLNATFYANQILPQAIAIGKVIQSGDTSCLDPSLFTEA